MIGCDRIGISVFRMRQRHTLTCAAARTVVFVWGAFKTPTHHPCILHVFFFSFFYTHCLDLDLVSSILVLGDRIYMYCMVHYVICDYIKLRVDLRVHPQPCVT